jgi:hypothetical protein
MRTPQPQLPLPTPRVWEAPSKAVQQRRSRREMGTTKKTTMKRAMKARRGLKGKWRPFGKCLKALS